MSQSLEDALKGIQAEILRRSEIVEPWHSYWYNRPLRGFPPRSTRFPSEYDGTDRLSLACTQTDLPSKKQRELVKEWCAILPSLSDVRILWFHSKVTQELLNAACRMKNLKGLYIKWSDIKDLTPISGLSNLTHLHIGGAPSAEPIHALCALQKLVDLELSNVTAAGDISFLKQLPQLKSLDISGDGNSLKRLKIETLEPLKVLANLERLAISTVTAVDVSLEPITHLTKLKFLMLSNQFRMEEFALLAGKLPLVDCDRFSPFDGPVDWKSCKKCGNRTMVLLRGKGKPWLCKSCDDKRIDKHVAEFNRIVQAAATSAS